MKLANRFHRDISTEHCCTLVSNKTRWAFRQVIPPPLSFRFVSTGGFLICLKCAERELCQVHYLCSLKSTSKEKVVGCAGGNSLLCQPCFLFRQQLTTDLRKGKVKVCADRNLAFSVLSGISGALLCRTAVFKTLQRY